MNGFAGSSRPKRQKQELAGSNGAVPASKRESGDPVVGLAVRIVEIIAIHIHCTRFRSWGLRRTVIGLCGSPLWRANDWAGEKFANGFANEPRSTGRIITAIHDR